MKPTSDLAPAFPARPRIALAFAALSIGLGGCSTIKSVSPFTSGVPYAQDVQPTVARPASPEVPVYKKSAAPPEAPAAPPPPPPPAPPPAAAAAPPPPAGPPAEATPAAPPPAELAPPQAHSATGATDGAAPKPGPDASAAAPSTAEASTTDADLPTIPAERRVFQDDGRYANLADVPNRPKNLPTFADARAQEKSMVANRTGASEPAVPTAGAATASRPEDRAPCDAGERAASQPTATIRFDQGSSALTSNERAILADALPDVRGGSGTIRIVGHGDTEPGIAQTDTRFNLAVARAGAVAEALAGFGIPAQRIAVSVACVDGATAGASVQLYL